MYVQCHTYIRAIYEVYSFTEFNYTCSLKLLIVITTKYHFLVCISSEKSNHQVLSTVYLLLISDEHLTKVEIGQDAV